MKKESKKKVAKSQSSSTTYKPYTQSSISSPSKYSPPERPKTSRKVFVDTDDLPASYNTTSVTLIPRDPYWIYAYWEIAPNSLEEIKRQIGNMLDQSSYVLRIYDVTLIDFNGSNANQWFDIDVGPHTNNWYVNLQRDHVTYCGEIGIRTPDGRFLALGRSNFVTTPRATSTGRLDTVWMEVKDDRPRPPFVIVEAKKANPGKVSPSAKNKPRRKIYLTEEDIKVYYFRLFPSLKEVMSADILPKSNRKSSHPSDRGYKTYIKDRIPLEEFLIRDLSRGQFIKEILLGSSEKLVSLGGESEFVKEISKGGASEREKKERKFFFEIGTELIVYGRTEPGAEVWLGDSKIKLREDGTFTLRFALPEGEIPLDFVAQSRDKVDKKSIKTAVRRTKTTSSTTSGL